MNTFNEDLQKQVDEIKAMIEYNNRKAGQHIETAIEERKMTEEQYLSLLKRTRMMIDLLKEVEKLDK